MAKITVNPDGSGGFQRTQVPLPQRDHVVSQQIGTLLAAANSFMAFIANTRPVDEGPEVKPIDGGVKCAVEATLIGVCDRIDKLMADDSRWSMDFQNTLEAQLSMLYKTHQDYMTESRDAVRKAGAPQARLSPRLLRLESGTWIAFIGDPQGENSAIGMGNCVQDALDNFDKVIEGKPAGFIEQWLKNYEQNSRMDESGSQEAQGTEPDPSEAGNRPAPGAEPKSRRAKAGKTPRRRRSRKPRT